MRVLAGALACLLGACSTSDPSPEPAPRPAPTTTDPTQEVETGGLSEYLDQLNFNAYSDLRVMIQPLSQGLREPADREVALEFVTDVLDGGSDDPYDQLAALVPTLWEVAYYDSAAEFSVRRDAVTLLGMLAERGWGIPELEAILIQHAPESEENLDRPLVREAAAQELGQLNHTYREQGVRALAHFLEQEWSLISYEEVDLIGVVLAELERLPPEDLQSAIPGLEGITALEDPNVNRLVELASRILRSARAVQTVR